MSRKHKIWLGIGILPKAASEQAKKGGTEASSFTGKGQKMFHPAVRTADQGESAARISAVEILLHDVLDDRSKIAEGLLEMLLVLRSESFEMMEKHPIENRTFRMS